MFKSILLAVDGSEESNKAIDYVKSLAEKYNSKILILNVFELPLLVDPYDTHAQIFQDIENNLRTNSQTLLEDVKNKFSDLNIQIEGQSFQGRIGSIIVEVANKSNIDLIVMGSRGLGSVKSLLLGSVSNYVTNHAKCPLILVK